jgi:hypothetical protein
MSEFMLLVRGKDPLLSSPEKLQKRMETYVAWMQKMMAEGRYKGGQPLEEGEGKLLKNKEEVVSDGPFMEVKEMIGGYVIISANDINEAVEIAKTCPLLNDFQLEVRKLKAMN